VAKPPLRLKHDWSIWTKLQIEGRARVLAMFNLAIDSKLRGGDVVAIRSRMSPPEATQPPGQPSDKGKPLPVRFELSEQSRQAVDEYLKAANKRRGEFLFTGRRGPDRNMTTRQYARLVWECANVRISDPK
jgi:integrase